MKDYNSNGVSVFSVTETERPAPTTCPGRRWSTRTPARPCPAPSTPDVGLAPAAASPPAPWPLSWPSSPQPPSCLETAATAAAATAGAGPGHGDRLPPGRAVAGVRVPGGTGWSGTRITRRVTVPTDVDRLRLLRCSERFFVCLYMHAYTLQQGIV